MHRLLAHRPSPAMVIALVALFVALGGSAYAALKLPKNSVGAAQLKKGAVTPPKLSPSAKAIVSKGGPGAPGAAGPQGPKGDAGPRGDTGPQGPGANTLIWNAPASASPSPTTVGTLLGNTFSAECLIPGPGEAEANVYVVTSDGSLRWDFGFVGTDNGVNSARSSSVDAPAGTIVAPMLFANATAEAGQKSDHNTEIVQTGPVRGFMNLHVAASTAPSQGCHVSVMGFPSA